MCSPAKIETLNKDFDRIKITEICINSSSRELLYNEANLKDFITDLSDKLEEETLQMSSSEFVKERGKIFTTTYISPKKEKVGVYVKLYYSVTND